MSQTHLPFCQALGGSAQCQYIFICLFKRLGVTFGRPGKSRELQIIKINFSCFSFIFTIES